MSTEENDQIGQLLGEIQGLNRRIDEGRTKAGQADGGREAAAKDGQVEIAAQLTALDQAKAMADLTAQVAALKAAITDTRSPSMAARIGGGTPAESHPNRMINPAGMEASPALKAMFRDYQAGELAAALYGVSSISDGFDPERHAWAKAKLSELGVTRHGPGDADNVKGYFTIGQNGKATLGTTGATGGYVLPNNLVDRLIKPNTQAAVYTAGGNPLVTVISGVAVRGVDLPYRTGSPSKLLPIDWGSTKTNINEAYGSYTATLATFAAIYDVSKQYLRFSAGSAETDIVDELTKAQYLSENYYTIAGAGTGSVGSGDPTNGVYTQLTAAGMAGAYTTAFSGSNSTVAGSGAAGLATAFQALAARSRYPSAVVVDATTYWTIFRQGSDTAGFWMSDFLGAGFSPGTDNTLNWRGVPIYYDANLGTNATTKIAIVADWKQLKFFRGMEFRIDSSDVAGTRWDTNLVGFRGELEFGVNAAPAIFTGAFQFVTGIIP